jgi:hypothetical protein
MKKVLIREEFASAFAIGLIVVAIAVGAVLFMQRGAHMDLTGPMSVRVLPTSDNDALAMVNLRITNPSDYPFEVRNVTVILETKAGEFPREIVSRSDTERLFSTMPEAGPAHPTLYTKAIIPPHTTTDYTVAAQFNAPERILHDRKRFVVKIEEIDGKTAEFSEK